MANTYCTATHTGKGFYTTQDTNNFYLSGHPGEVWVVGNTNLGVHWINRVNGIAKLKADAQAIVDGVIEAEQATWDALPADKKAPADGHQEIERPEKYTLP